MPPEGSALQSLRKFLNAPQSLQVTQSFLGRILGQEIDKTALKGQCMFPAFSFDLGCHQGGRGGANGTGLRLKRYPLDFTLGRLPNKNRDLVATSRVVAGTVSRRRRKSPPISRPFAVI